MNGIVILVEDDEVLGGALAQRLRLERFAPHWARSVAEGEALLRRHAAPLCVLCDMRLPDGSGEELLARLLPSLGRTPVIAMTAFGGVDQAVRLIRAGADDYLLKPFPVEVLVAKLKALAPARAAPHAPGEAGWGSPPMQALGKALDKVAAASATVLLIGESGAGKEIAARRLHASGPRGRAPFVALNCAAIPRDLLESEVFGHERGAFTGATERRIGAAERAGEGTLLLDEVGDLEPALQAKLLRLLEDRRFTRVGGSQDQPLRARIVAATNADLAARVAEGRFRGDLYWRLAVIALRVPPLRERAEDILPLAHAFLRDEAADARKTPPRLAPDAAAALAAHAWPGNIRELRNRIGRAVLLAEGDTLGMADLFPDQAAPQGRKATGLSLADARDAAERAHIRRVIAHCGGRMNEAARMLDISRTTLWERMRRLGMSGEQHD